MKTPIYLLLSFYLIQISFQKFPIEEVQHEMKNFLSDKINTSFNLNFNKALLITITNITTTSKIFNTTLNKNINAFIYDIEVYLFFDIQFTFSKKGISELHFPIFKTIKQTLSASLFIKNLTFKNYPDESYQLISEIVPTLFLFDFGELSDFKTFQNILSKEKWLILDNFQNIYSDFLNSTLIKNYPGRLVKLFNDVFEYIRLQKTFPFIFCNFTEQLEITELNYPKLYRYQSDILKARNISFVLTIPHFLLYNCHVYIDEMTLIQGLNHFRFINIAYFNEDYLDNIIEDIFNKVLITFR